MAGHQPLSIAQVGQILLSTRSMVRFSQVILLPSITDPPSLKGSHIGSVRDVRSQTPPPTATHGHGLSPHSHGLLGTVNNAIHKRPTVLLNRITSFPGEHCYSSIISLSTLPTLLDVWPCSRATLACRSSSLSGRYWRLAAKALIAALGSTQR